MNQLKLKVCGMGQPENVAGLVDLCPDFIGFIFYKKSSRYMKDLDENLLKEIPATIKKVGVFVNEELSVVLELVEKFGLDYVQLHGDEDLDYCYELKSKGVQIIKVFRLMDEIPVSIGEYSEVADYFLFDTQTPNYGGSGKHFDWSILNGYNLETPFLLSGGIKLEDIEDIRKIDSKALVGIDVNSKFEIEPGLKDLKMIGELRKQL
ncbi:MAG: phosphoribosylanthranilate isomerase [Ekhidna sp.]